MNNEMVVKEKPEKRLKNTTDPIEITEIRKEIAKLENNRDYFINELTSRHMRFALKAAHEFKYLSTSFSKYIVLV